MRSSCYFGRAFLRSDFFFIKKIQKDISLLNSIKDYFGIGSVAIKTKGCVFNVQAIKDLDVILNYFDHYPLVTKKHADYLLFKLAINLIKEKAHLSTEGLRKLVAIRAFLNWGLPSGSLSRAYCLS